MGAAPKWRTQHVREDAADGCDLFAILPDTESDWPEEWFAFEETWPDWRCEECNQVWPGVEIACGYCGAERQDVEL